MKQQYQSSAFTITICCKLNETACLACLFDGISPQSGTVWLVNGVSIEIENPFLQVNSNGTLIIRRPQYIFSGEIQLSCRGQNITFIITVTLMSKSCSLLYACSQELLIRNTIIKTLCRSLMNNNGENVFCTNSLYYKI